MRTAWKVLAGLAVLLAIGIAVAVATIDVNALVAPVRVRVKAATGRDLLIRGGVRVAWSLEPRIVLADVALANAPWGAAKEMLSAQRLELELALLPLLSRRVELKELTLVAPVIALETDAKGRRNWEFASLPAGTSADAGSGMASAFAIGNVALEGGTLTYRDGATGGVTAVAIEQLSVRTRGAGAPIAAEFRGKIDDVVVTLAGTIGPVDALLQKRWPYPVDVHGEVAGQKAALATKVNATGTRYALDDLKLTVGANDVTGSFAVDVGGARPKLQFDLAGPAIALNALPVPVTAAKRAPAAPGKAGPAYVIPDTPIGFAPLRAVDAQGALRLERLTLPDGRTLDRLRAKITLDGGRLAVTDFSVAALGGSLAGSAVVDAAKSDAPALAVELSGKGLALAEILKAVGQRRDVRGGSTDVGVSLAMRGASPHAWAASASGSVRIVVGPATLANTKLDLDSALDQLTQAVNPFRTRDPSTELTCAVVRLPLKDGVARVDRSIAMESQKVGISASGTVDFRNETLAFTFQPKVRGGIPIDIANVAELVRVSGPFTHPQVSVDAAGSAKALASLGAAVGTGGLSMVAQSLFSWADGKGPGPCQIALGAATPTANPAGSSRPPDPVAPLVDDVGRAVGKLLGK
ncbi:MAG: AsmA family protein [Burkholderiales bacterium]